jgi:putative nucleotidyltransferase with HDIG domain
MLDIFKLKKKKEDQPSTAPSSVSMPKELQKQPSEKPEVEPTIPLTPPPPAPAPMAKIILGKIEKIPPEEIYQGVVNLVTDIIQKGLQNEPVEAKIVKAHLERLVDQMLVNSDELLSLVSSRTDLVDDYIYVHSVNVCLLSLAIGLELDYDRDKLVELAIGALLHDIGMAKVLPIADKPTKLTPEEYEEIKKHPIYGVEILEKVYDINTMVVYVISQHHERSDGSGYPKGFKGEQINEYARIVAIADVYDAVIHPRKYRRKMMPYDALKEVIQGKAYFDQNFLRALLNKISVYPVGSLVELSSGEIAMIFASNRNSPLRPAVKVLIDHQGHKLEEPRIMDLAEHVTVYIKKPISYSLE